MEMQVNAERERRALLAKVKVISKLTVQKV